jgi:hypothetical protein
MSIWRGPFNTNIIDGEKDLIESKLEVTLIKHSAISIEK